MRTAGFSELEPAGNPGERSGRLGIGWLVIPARTGSKSHPQNRIYQYTAEVAS